MFPGPIVGIGYKAEFITPDRHIKELRFVYDTCFCDFAGTPATSTLLMGEQQTINFSVVSKIGSGIFNDAADSCNTATRMGMVEKDDSFSLNNFVGTISTTDGAQAGPHSVQFETKAGTGQHVLTTTVTFEI